jgi:NADH:ubiquinone oxidoreductase subunit K
MFNVEGPMKGLGSSVVGTIVALFVIALAAGAVAVGWRFGNTRSPI